MRFSNMKNIIKCTYADLYWGKVLLEKKYKPQKLIRHTYADVYWNDKNFNNQCRSKIISRKISFKPRSKLD